MNTVDMPVGFGLGIWPGIWGMKAEGVGPDVECVEVSVAKAVVRTRTLPRCKVVGGS